MVLRVIEKIIKVMVGMGCALWVLILVIPIFLVLGLLVVGVVCG